MLITKSGRYSHGLLTRIADRAAGELEAAGIGPGDPVVVCLPNDVRWVAVYLALRRIGAVGVPLHAGSAVEEIAHVLGDSGARLALVPGAVAAALTGRFPDRLVWPDGYATGARIARGPASPGPTGVATIAYTSGTTGRPKGVLQSAEAVAAGGQHLTHRMGWDTGDVVISALPLAHSYGTNVLNAVLAAEATLVVLPRFDEPGLFEAVTRTHATAVTGVPTMFRRLLAHPDAELLAGLRCALSAGQSAGAELARDWEASVGGAFAEGWGMTELAGFAALAAPDLPDRHGTVGTAVPGIRLRVRTDELQVAGIPVTAGYLGSAAGCVDTDGWLRTGDLGSIDATGRVRIHGRAKDVVLSGGFTIHPAEVERILARHPAIRDVAVAGLPDPVLGEVTCAWIVPRSATPPDLDRIVEFCRPHLATYKLPRRLVVLPALPRTGTGKVVRRDLPAPDLAGTSA